GAGEPADRDRGRRERADGAVCLGRLLDLGLGGLTVAWLELDRVDAGAAAADLSVGEAAALAEARRVVADQSRERLLLVAERQAGDRAALIVFFAMSSSSCSPRMAGVPSAAEPKDLPPASASDGASSRG